MIKKQMYEDYASGRVIYGAPGATLLPVRLTSEVFEWCDSYFTSKKIAAPYTIYDPLCGIAYALTVLGFVYGPKIKTIFASDTDKKMLEFATKNLSLLTHEGLTKRIQELQHFINAYKKESHQEALESGVRLYPKAVAQKDIHVFQHDALGTAPLPKDVKNVNLIFTDIPLGNADVIERFLAGIKDVLQKDSLLSLGVHKKQVVSHPGYTKLKTFKLGLRKIILLAPVR